MHIRRMLLLFLGILMVFAPFGLAERIYPPFATADVRSSSHGHGSSGGAAYPSGCILLYAQVKEITDHAAATAKLGTLIEVQTDSEVVLWFRLSHTSGSAGLRWFGQMSEVIARPYLSTEGTPAVPGMSHRLSGAPLADAAEQYLEALALVPREEGAMLSPIGWAAADALREAEDDEERVQAWATILREGAREGCLQILLDELERLGHLQHEEVRLTFSAQPGVYAVGLAVEVTASPHRPGNELSWVLGRLDRIEVDIIETEAPD